MEREGVMYFIKCQDSWELFAVDSEIPLFYGECGYFFQPPSYFFWIAVPLEVKFIESNCIFQKGGIIFERVWT